MSRNAGPRSPVSNTASRWRKSPRGCDSWKQEPDRHNRPALEASDHSRGQRKVYYAGHAPPQTPPLPATIGAMVDGRPGPDLPRCHCPSIRERKKLAAIRPAWADRLRTSTNPRWRFPQCPARWRAQSPVPLPWGFVVKNGSRCGRGFPGYADAAVGDLEYDIRNGRAFGQFWRTFSSVWFSIVMNSTPPSGMKGPARPDQRFMITW